MPIPIGFDLNNHYLLCMIVLSDSLAEHLASKPGVGFFRAFIIEDQKTREVQANMRWRYADKDSWYHLVPKEQLGRHATCEQLRKDIEFMLRAGMNRFLGAQVFGSILAFYPPKPEDPRHTMDWLLAQDLIEKRT